MRKHLILTLGYFLLSCNSDKTSADDYRNEEIDLLKKENDSLKNILKNKYLFDNIGFRLIPSDETPQYNDRRFEGNLVLIGYNKTDYLLLDGEYNFKSRKFIDSDTIFSKNGTYPISVEKGKEKIQFYIGLDNTFASKTYDSIITVPYESLWKNK